MKIPTIGVEEEYQLVDPESGRLRPECKRVMNNLCGKPSAEIQHELHLNQIEMASPVLQTLSQIHDSLLTTRRQLAEAATASGAALIAAGTNPMAVPTDSVMTPKPRYRALVDQYQQIARDLLIFGCHVHVDMPDRNLGVAVMNRTQRWLPALQALSANSPYWNERDTGYASYRRELWAQWPTAGPPPRFEDHEDHLRCVEELVRCGAIADHTFIYWDVRLPARVPTIEYRVADVMTDTEDTVGYVGLVRALVMQATHDAATGVPLRDIRPTILTYGLWEAARFGLSGSLIDVVESKKIPAADAIDRLFEFVKPALAISGDTQRVESFLDRTLQRGCGADHQRRIAGQERDLATLIGDLIARTKFGL